MKNNNELYHFGIPGMKWGVRRFQNSDGTYTEEGKLRRRVEDFKIGKQKTEKKQTNNPRKMSDEELERRVKRLQKEVEYRKLSNQANPGKAYTLDLLKNIGSKVIVTASAGAILYAMKASLGGEFNYKEFANAVFNGGAKKK